MDNREKYTFDYNTVLCNGYTMSAPQIVAELKALQNRNSKLQSAHDKLKERVEGGIEVDVEYQDEIGYVASPIDENNDPCGRMTLSIHSHLKKWRSYE